MKSLLLIQNYKTLYNGNYSLLSFLSLFILCSFFLFSFKSFLSSSVTNDQKIYDKSTPLSFEENSNQIINDGTQLLNGLKTTKLSMCDIIEHSQNYFQKLEEISKRLNELTTSLHERFSTIPSSSSSTNSINSNNSNLTSYESNMSQLDGNGIEYNLNKNLNNHINTLINLSNINNNNTHYNLDDKNLSPIEDKLPPPSLSSSDNTTTGLSTTFLQYITEPQITSDISNRGCLVPQIFFSDILKLNKDIISYSERLVTLSSSFPSSFHSLILVLDFLL